MVSKEEKINNIISELDRQVDGIKQFSNVLEQIKQLSNSTQKLSGQVLTNSEKYINITNQLDDSLSMIKMHIEKVSTASESRLENIQNNSLHDYKKLIEDTTRIIQEIEHKIIDSNTTINKQIESIEDVSTASELRLKNNQKNSLHVYKRLLEDATRIIQEIEHKIIDSNATINKQIKSVEGSIKKDIKEVSDDLNRRFSDMGNKLDDYQSILVQSNSVNTKKLMMMIIGMSILIFALVITGHYEWVLEFMNKMFS
jgi:hypothetical protein